MNISPMSNMYIEKDGVEFANLLGYNSHKQEDGTYIIKCHKVYLTDEIIKAHLSLTNLKDFDLIIENQVKKRKIMYTGCNILSHVEPAMIFDRLTLAAAGRTEWFYNY